MSKGREFWVAHVTAWRRCGMSARGYSAKHDLAKGTLGYWSCRLRREERSKVQERDGRAASGPNERRVFRDWSRKRKRKYEKVLCVRPQENTHQERTHL